MKFDFSIENAFRCFISFSFSNSYFIASRFEITLYEFSSDLKISKLI